MPASSSAVVTFALSLVSVQFGIQPFLTERYISRDCIKSSLVILQELLKVVLCVVVLLLSGQLGTQLSSWSLSNSLRVALIPAMIFAVQNVLAYYAYLQLDPLTFNLINQSKIIFSALFLKLILDKTPTVRQSIALFILFASSVMLSIETATSSANGLMGTDNDDRESMHGLIAILLASIMSGLAGSLVQKALQAEKQPRNSILYSIELAVYAVVATLIRLAAEYQFGMLDGSLIVAHGFAHAMDVNTLLPLVVNAAGGIGVGLITKHTSVIHKSYCMIVGILLSGVFRRIFYAKEMSGAMYVAVVMVMFSMWLNADATKTRSAAPPNKKEQ